MVKFDTNIAKHLLEPIIEYGKKKRVVLFAGAGVSSSPPSKLPGWYAINEKITWALCKRIDDYLGREGYTKELREIIDSRRKSNRFPPDYQAQILEEVSGDLYFKALQSLDIEQFNNSHLSIAWLAKKGLLNCIVTTNFDRLIEKALDKLDVHYEVDFGKASYKSCLDSLQQQDNILYVIKVHGCVCDHKSMIDTLKQRLKGRNTNLLLCMDILLKNNYFIYTGFSADDLLLSNNYLQILSNASHSPGLIYIQWPGPKENKKATKIKLSEGAILLRDTYGSKASVLLEETDVFSDVLCAQLGFKPSPKSKNTITSETDSFVNNSLNSWANNLHPAAAVTCLVAIAEASGQTNTGFSFLERFRKDVFQSDRVGMDYANFLFYHGRIGIGQGLLSLVRNEHGELTNAAYFSIQSLVSVSKSIVSKAWMASARLWAGEVSEANSLCNEVVNKLRGLEKLNILEIDSWLAASEVAFIMGEWQYVLNTFDFVYKEAEKIGDLPRKARILALVSLFYAEYFPNDFLSIYEKNKKDTFKHAERLNDPHITAFQNLSLGRYYTKKQNSKLAKDYLEKAYNDLQSTARNSWLLYSRIEFAKALIDSSLENNKDIYLADELINEINTEIDDFQILLPWFEELIGQYRMCKRDVKEARNAFENAVSFSEKLGLKYKKDQLKKYFELL